MSLAVSAEFVGAWMATTKHPIGLAKNSTRYPPDVARGAYVGLCDTAVYEILAAKCVLDRPDDGHISHARRIGVQDTDAVHEPNRNVAAGGVAPQNVALAVTVEVARPSDLEADGDISHPRRVGIQDGGAVHFPDCDVAAGITPHNVAVTVGVEVAGGRKKRGIGRASCRERV